MRKTKEAHKTRYIRGWIGDQKTQHLMKYELKGSEWENHKTIIERFKAKFQPKGRNQRNKCSSELRYFNQTSEGFKDFWIEMKRKFDLAKKVPSTLSNIRTAVHVGRNTMRRSWCYSPTCVWKNRESKTSYTSFQMISTDKYVEIGEN